jgi:hypothetical protein
MTVPGDVRVIACNYATSTRIAVKGGLAYLTGGNTGDGGERRTFLVRSRGGRWVDKWERVDRLTNFRYTTIPPEHGMYARLTEHRAHVQAYYQAFLVGERDTHPAAYQVPAEPPPPPPPVLPMAEAYVPPTPPVPPHLRPVLGFATYGPSIGPDVVGKVMDRGGEEVIVVSHEFTADGRARLGFARMYVDDDDDVMRAEMYARVGLDPPG